MPTSRRARYQSDSMPQRGPASGRATTGTRTGFRLVIAVAECSVPGYWEAGSNLSGPVLLPKRASKRKQHCAPRDLTARLVPCRQSHRNDQTRTTRHAPDGVRTMALHNISQLPILDGGRALGVIDKSAVLWVVGHKRQDSQDSTGSAMSRSPETVDRADGIDAVVAIIRRDLTETVADRDLLLERPSCAYLLNHLRSESVGPVDTADLPSIGSSDMY